MEVLPQCRLRTDTKSTSERIEVSGRYSAIPCGKRPRQDILLYDGDAWWLLWGTGSTEAWLTFTDIFRPGPRTLSEYPRLH